MSQAAHDVTNAAAYELAAIDEDCVHATAFGILFMVWRRRTTVDAFSRGMVLGLRYSERLGSKIGCCQVVDIDAVPPDADARKAFADFLQRTFFARSAVIHDGTGFKAASVRAIVNLQILVSKPSFPHVLYSTVRQAAVALATERVAVARGATPANVEAVIGELRALHRTRFP